MVGQPLFTEGGPTGHRRGLPVPRWAWGRTKEAPHQVSGGGEGFQEDEALEASKSPISLSVKWEQSSLSCLHI